MRHKKGTGFTTTPNELHSAESKMRMTVEKPDENNKMSLIFLMACFIGMTSGFLIGYMTGVIGGMIFGTGYGNQFFSYAYKNDLDVYAMITSFVPAALYFYGSFGIAMRNREFRRLDMRRHMVLSGALVSMGSVVTVLATSEYVCQLGPNVFALGFGIMYQGAQVYMCEMGFAHRNYLGSLSVAFKMMIAVGIFVANLVNCCTNGIEGGWGWKVSIGIAAIPAATISVGAYLLPDTPIRKTAASTPPFHGTNDNDVYVLLKDLFAAHEASKSAKGCDVMSQTQNRPYCLTAIALPLFQQLTGMNVMVMYAPYLFQVIGFRTGAALTYTAVIGAVNVAATVIGLISVSRGCRRSFLIAGGVQLCLGGTAAYDYFIIATTCICVSGFAWSWGPLGWMFLSSDDILLFYPSEVRSCGQNLASKVHWIVSSFMTFVFPFVFRLYKLYVLYLFTFFVVVMTLLAYYFMPDTNQILVEEDVSRVWKQHWFWRRYFVDLDDDLMV
ncbi:hypothetical protein MKW94_016537 [Papaver nudicaule]|uniref:Major facilitator superfamily (MFS) profile domain-containing protein n=1 Tax=Papaver nudicaule TaxID=74823 RepID=A0AA42B0N2_PAPNU|nr:hypothetical protein [Papaver nudicaule]